MPDKELEELFDRYLAGDATPAEIKTLMEWLEQPENEGEASRLLERGWERSRPGGDVFEASVSERMLHSIHNAVLPKEEARPFRLARIFTFGRVAAAIILLSLGGLYLATRTSSRQDRPLLTQRTDRLPLKDIPPGTDGAILRLADGRQIVLDSAGNGELTHEGNTAIVKKAGQLVYTEHMGSDSRSVPDAGKSAICNTLFIPRGRQYQLLLPDGSHVWLNAASSIRYPVAFTGKERLVEITGEAYFEVAPDASRPFRVKAGETRVDVLGTHFNIMAYEEDEVVKTTLLEGAVKVTRAGTSHLLQPGQQAQLRKNRSDQAFLIVDDAPVSEAVAWKNGLFLFNRSSLQTVMQQIARWYDVQIVYEGEIPAMEFGGKISRHNNISEVLKILELSKVHFRIEDKKIIVMP